MDEIKVYLVTEEYREKAAGLMVPEVGELLRLGLPLTTIVATYGNTAAGVLSGSVSDGDFFIHSLYVHPDYRRKGMGRALMEKMFRFLKGRILSIRVEYTLQSVDHEGLRPFLLEMGFRELPFLLPVQCMTVIEDLHLTSGNMPEQGRLSNERGIFPFSQVSERSLRMATLRGKNEGHPLPRGGLLSPKIDQEVSYCVSSMEGIEAYIAVEKVDEDTIYVSAVWAEVIGGKSLSLMISSALAKARQKYKPDTQVFISARNERAMNVIEKLGGGLVNCSYRFEKKFY